MISKHNTINPSLFSARLGYLVLLGAWFCVSVFSDRYGSLPSLWHPFGVILESSRSYFGDLGLHLVALDSILVPLGPSEVKVGFCMKFKRFCALLWVPILAHVLIKVIKHKIKCEKVDTMNNVTHK